MSKLSPLSGCLVLRNLNLIMFESAPPLSEKGKNQLSDSNCTKGRQTHAHSTDDHTSLVPTENQPKNEKGQLSERQNAKKQQIKGSEHPKQSCWENG